ncbi:uncharacterized protein LOC126978064 [Leptidea sinapis]|uniref:uncharacterized protein LOC126978064 n=1 Tax=Leptidea sinapis TaxID=189913 RepID=UPI0021C4B1D0|nr:uncharacterized protein LOC126978064 [Leptidea sinapis]
MYIKYQHRDHIPRRGHARLVRGAWQVQSLDLLLHVLVESRLPELLARPHGVLLQIVNAAGPGVWYVNSIESCVEQLANELVTISVKKHKLNRTHYGFDAVFELHDVIGDTGDGVMLDICKHSDGGCKQIQVLSDEMVGNFGEKYAKSNMIAAFTMAGIDPPEFPIQPGTYTIENFYFDLCELPEKAMYGTFTALAYIIRNSERIACSSTTVEFRDEEDEYCERD